MFKCVLAVLFIISCKVSPAQNADSGRPNYEKIPTIPPFRLWLAPDSILFTKQELRKKKQTVIMIFSPDCDHCIHFTEELLLHAAAFKDLQVIMAASGIPFDHVREFYSKEMLSKHPNIKAGIDHDFFLATFYGVGSYPALFLYNKKGRFKAAFDATVTWEKLKASL